MFESRFILFIILILISINTNAENHYDYDYDGGGNNADGSSNDDYQLPLNTTDCVYFSQTLANCSCTQNIINCAYKGYYELPDYLNATNKTQLRLIFKNNQLTKFKQISYNNSLIELNTIDLSDNQINFIDLNALNSTSSTLEYLLLSNNNDLNDLNRLANSSIEFSRLKSIKLNNIKNELQVDNELFNTKHFPNLTEIYIQNTKLKYNTTSLIFNNLTSLTVLILRNNNLNVFPCNSIKTLTNLGILAFESNKLSDNVDSVFACFNGLNHLYRLELKSNNLNDQSLKKLLQNGDDYLKNLEYLDLRSNNLKVFPYTAFSSMVLLKQLLINFVTDEQQTFEKSLNEKFTVGSGGDDKNLLKFLVALDLSNTRIKSITNTTFQNFQNIQELTLDNCLIESVNETAFSGLNNLRRLYLQKNKIQTIYYNNTIFNYSQLTDFDLQFNELVCNCSISWLYDIDIKSSLTTNLTCKNSDGKILRIKSQEFKSLCVVSPAPAVQSHHLLYAYGILFLSLFILSVIVGIVYLRRRHIMIRNRQYRYRFFTETSQDDILESMQDLPVYRDTTVSLQIHDIPESQASKTQFLRSSNTSAATSTDAASSYRSEQHT